MYGWRRTKREKKERERIRVEIMQLLLRFLFSVAPVTKEEEAKYVDIDFDPEDFRKDIGTPGKLM